MTRARFIMLGGFLGAGKTTAVSRLAKHYIAQGKRVGVVTNDQAQGLVDTSTLRSQGLNVEEVPGACFCCRFDELIAKIAALGESERPDIILAEPVGSCTDLVATVIQPLRDLYGDRFSIAPYAVLFKPSHGMKILGGSSSGFSPKAAYIFMKQLEEADAVAINRIDEMSPSSLERLTALVSNFVPATPLFKVSARTGSGFDDLIEFLERDGEFGRRILDIDYDVYAEGEAELGWLNVSAALSASTGFDLDDLLREVIDAVGIEMVGHGGEVAHLKAIGLTESTYGVANLVASGGLVELSLPARTRVSEVELVVNARAAVDPSILESTVIQALHRAAKCRGAAIEIRKAQSLRPGRPVPTHRYSTQGG